MKTSAFISRAMREFPGATRAFVKDEMNIALSTLIKKPLALMRVIDESTGKDPVLSTTAGVHTYIINGSNIGDDVKWITRCYTGEPDDARDYDEIAFTAKPYGTTDAQITFYDDPGGKDIKLSAYKGPTTILSETFPAEIPLPEEYVIEYLYELVAGTLEQIFHGKSLRKRDFMASAIHTFWGEASEDTKTAVRYSRERYT